MGARVYGRWFAVVLLLTVGAGVPGCASSGGGSSVSGRQDVLTAEQMSSVNTSNLYEIVERLRPRWLRVRDVGSLSGQGGRGIAVVRGGAVLGGVEVLRSMGPDGILELRYKDGEAASILVGSRDGFVEGVIEIVRARR